VLFKLFRYYEKKLTITEEDWTSRDRDAEKLQEDIRKETGGDESTQRITINLTD